MAPSFYALLNREQKVGATLHKVAKGFDTGDILCQVEVPIAVDDSVESLTRKRSELGGDMLVRYSNNTATPWEVAEPLVSDAVGYRSLPHHGL